MRPAFSTLLETKCNCHVVESQKTESSIRTGCRNWRKWTLTKRECFAWESYI